MASVATKTATPVMPPSFSMSQDISRAMTASNQKTEKNRSILIDGMPPAPPPSPVAFSKGKTCYNNIPSLSLEWFNLFFSFLRFGFHYRHHSSIPLLLTLLKKKSLYHHPIFSDNGLTLLDFRDCWANSLSPFRCSLPFLFCYSFLTWYPRCLLALCLSLWVFPSVYLFCVAYWI